MHKRYLQQFVKVQNLWATVWQNHACRSNVRSKVVHSSQSEAASLESKILPVRSVFQQVEHRVRRVQLQENPQSVSPVFPPERREISQWRPEGLRKHPRTRTHILVFFSVLRSACFIQSVNAMFEDGRFSLMSPLILPLQPVRQLYSFSPASGAGAGPEGQVFAVIGRRCVNTGVPWYSSGGLMQR